MDQQCTIGELRAAVEKFIEARDWRQYHTPKNVAMSIAIEAAEIMEHFQWMSIEQSVEAMQDAAKRAEVADELADVLIYCLSFANSTGIDVSHAIQLKLARNEIRFPVPEVSGER